MKRRPTLAKAAFALAIAFKGALAQSLPPPSEAASNSQQSLGYKSVAEALEAVKAKPSVNVNITKPDSWVIATEAEPFVQWSFAPSGHYAYPAVVRRTLKQSANGDLSLEMTALCQAEKEPCDRLMAEFEQLNERMRQAVRARLQQPKEK